MRVARTVHIGPYDRLGDAHNAIHAWCAAHNRKIGQASWEIYGDWNSNPALLETTIKYCLPDGQSSTGTTALEISLPKKPVKWREGKQTA